MIGELTNYTVGANGREMPFASCQLAKPFGCFQTCKVLPPANRGERECMECAVFC